VYLEQLIRENHADFIGIQETKKVFQDSFLRNLTSPASFSWHFLLAKVTAGGIFVGCKDEVLLMVVTSPLIFLCPVCWKTEGMTSVGSQ
jgi:hypothetical protein